MSRLKRVLKRLGIGLAILIAVLLIINGAYSWHTGRQLEQRLAKLRAAGEPWSMVWLPVRFVMRLSTVSTWYSARSPSPPKSANSSIKN